MSTIAPSLPEQSHINFYQIKKGIMSWVWTMDHKRIGLMYLSGVTFFFLFAVAMGFLIRLELFTSNAPGEAGILGSSDFYNRVLTIHGVSMVFLFIIPGIPGAFGNFFLPIMIGADDVAFPRLNLLSWYFYVGGATPGIVRRPPALEHAIEQVAEKQENGRDHDKSAPGGHPVQCFIFGNIVCVPPRHAFHA